MDINQIYTTIQAQEVNFPVPTTTETLTVGTVKVGYSNPGVKWTYIEPFFVYNVPTWTDNNGLKLCGGPVSSDRLFGFLSEEIIQFVVVEAVEM
jgi:hypothetical protein